MSEKQIAQRARKLRRIMSEQLGFGSDFDSLSPGDKVVVDCAATGQFRWSDAVADRDVDLCADWRRREGYRSDQHGALTAIAGNARHAGLGFH